MPAAMVTALAAPIRRVQALVGAGWLGAGDPADLLSGVRDALTDTADDAARAWRSADWSGGGAQAAGEFAASTVAAIDEAARRAGSLGALTERAAAAVAAARRRLRDIVEGFEATAHALEPRIGEPGVARELLTAARDALGDAVGVVEELRAELDGYAAALDAQAPGPAPTTPSGFGGPTGGAPGFGAGAPVGSGGLADLAAFTHAGGDEPDAADFGEGVEVRLPDGSVVLAPNAMAASAVRHALTQLGVPYQWGGTAPGVGLDCSGLTQWAYHEAGLNIPRLAQEQDIGAAISADSLRPGDLAVWDGHVAMIVGNGTMIEAGDPVQLSPVRTSNAGQGFQGFWRPTA